MNEKKMDETIKSETKWCDCFLGGHSRQTISLKVDDKYKYVPMLQEPLGIPGSNFENR